MATTGLTLSRRDSPPQRPGEGDIWPYGATLRHPLAGEVREFLTSLALTPVSGNTLRHYGHDLALFLRFLQRHKANVAHPAQIRPEVVRDFLSYLSHVRGNARSSSRRRLAAVKKFTRFLFERGYIPIDPASHLALTSKRRGAPTVLTKEEALRFLEASKMSRFPERDHAMFRLFLTCGCTLSELLNLKLADYDAAEGTIVFSGGRQKRRKLPLTDGCKRALERYFEEERPVAGGRHLFLNRKGEPITKGAVYHAFHRALERAGIEKEGLTVHSLRHTCLALLWRAGVSLHVLQEVAGHHSLATTREYAWAGPRETMVGTWRNHHPLEV